jgi:hypothetical protein
MASSAMPLQSALEVNSSSSQETRVQRRDRNARPAAIHRSVIPFFGSRLAVLNSAGRVVYYANAI